MDIHYSHLDTRERTLLKAWRGQGLGVREIGRRLNRHHTPSVVNCGEICGVARTTTSPVLSKSTPIVCVDAHNVTD